MAARAFMPINKYVRPNTKSNASDNNGFMISQIVGFPTAPQAVFSMLLNVSPKEDNVFGKFRNYMKTMTPQVFIKLYLCF